MRTIVFPLLVNIAVNELHVEDAVDRAEFDHDIVGDIVLDGDSHDVVARLVIRPTCMPMMLM